MDSDISPELHTIWNEAKSHIEQGDYNKAIEIYKYVLIRYSDSNVAAEYANAYLGDIYLTLRQLDLAENHIKKAISYNAEDPGYHYLLGFTYSVKSQWKMAIQEFKIAVDKKPDNGEYLRGLGWTTYSSGNTTKGLAYLHKAVDLAPSNADILTDLAVIYLSAANLDKSREYCERAVEVDPENKLAYRVLNDILRFQKEFQRKDEQSIKTRRKSQLSSDAMEIYQFKVSLKGKPDIWRIIEIKGNQMLSSLHRAIFKAFDRFDEHLYSFFMSNNPYDQKNEYTLPDPDENKPGKYANRIRIDSLYLEPGQRFLYLFDYGDSWWHEVELIKVREGRLWGKYPKIVTKHGKSPPQYSNSDE